LRWRNNAWATGGPVTAASTVYTVSRATYAASACGAYATLTAAETNPFYTDATVAAGTSYCYTVSATNGPDATSASSAVVTSVIASAAAVPSAEVSFPQANGAVRAVARSGNTVYLGGDFTKVGPLSSNGALFTTGTSTLSTKVSAVAGGVVRASAIDSSGRIYIGGTFTHVLNTANHTWVARANVARLTAAGLYDSSFTPAIAGGGTTSVNSIAVTSDGTVLIGGDFATAAGVGCAHLMGLDPTTGGAAAGWGACAQAHNGGTRSVLAMAVNGNTVYLGGDFTSLKGSAISNHARVSSGGTLTTNTYAINNTVRALATDGTTLYLGGDFTQVTDATLGTVGRTRLASITLSTGAFTNWSVAAGAAVHALALNSSGSTLFVGGAMTTLGSSTSVAGLGALSTSGTGSVLSTYTASAGGVTGGSAIVYGLAVDGSVLYGVGDFTNVASISGTSARAGAFALSQSVASLGSWDPGAYGTATPILRTVAISGTRMYLGGSFDAIGASTRTRLASVDATTGLLSSWAPTADSTVRSLRVYGSSVYVGGDFTQLNSVSQSYFGKLSAISGALDTSVSWAPNAAVYAIESANERILLGGDFTSFRGSARGYAAAFDPASGALDSFNPALSAGARAILFDGTRVYIGGAFTEGIKAYTYASGPFGLTDLAWTGVTITAATQVNALAKCSGGDLYMGGTFTDVEGTGQVGLARVDSTGALVSAFGTGANLTGGTASVNALVCDEAAARIFVAGDFTNAGGMARIGFAKLNSTTGGDGGFNVNASAAAIGYTIVPVRATAVAASWVWIGGSFTTLGTGPTTPSRFMGAVNAAGAFAFP